MDEELPFENEPVPAVGMSLSHFVTCGHFNKSCLKSSAQGLALSCSAQGSIDIFSLSKPSPILHVLWIVGLCDLCYFYWHGYSICLFCSEKLLYVNIQSFKKVWYQHEDRKELLITSISVVNIATPGIFTSDAWIMFSLIVFFSFLQWINMLVLNNIWIQIYLICSYAFSCYFLFAIFMKLHSAICTWMMLWACCNWHRWSAHGANQWNDWMFPGNAANMQQN